MINEQEAHDFLDKNPDIEVLEAFVIDVNGVPRGKWIPRERAVEVLMHSVGGLLKYMQDSTAIFAPHANSFRRLTPSEHAPTYASWGLDNRSADVRVISAGRSATRIEHRVAGADTNPYLVLAMILQAAYMGMIERVDPGGAITGDYHSPDLKPLERSWHSAVQNFAQSGFAYAAFGPDFRQLYTACKRQELQEFALRVTDVEYDAYIRTA